MKTNRNQIAENKAEIYERERHPISRREIDSDALKIMYRLIRHDYKAYLVGGGVRDLLLRKRPKDFDIATDATPRKVKELFGNSRIIGRRFKLVHVFFKANKIIEVSTFRDFTDPIDPEDAAENDELIITRDNRYGTEATDALRRDITINGLFYDLATFSIIDYVGGMRDLEDGIIRVIGEPDLRFAEDPVRLIRVVRHAARSNFEIERTCRDSLERNVDLILKSSQVRVYEELKKDLASGHLLQILRLLFETGLLRHLLPELTVRNGELLKTGELVTCLERIDALAKTGRAASATVVLTLITLFIATDREGELDPGTGSLFVRFPSGETLSESVHDCFSSLSVPKKERERIEAMLSAWYALASTPPEEAGRLHLGRLESAEDLRTLINIVDPEDRQGDQQKLDIVMAAPPRMGGRRKRGNRRRGRGRQGGHQRHGAF